MKTKQFLLMVSMLLVCIPVMANATTITNGNELVSGWDVRIDNSLGNAYVNVGVFEDGIFNDGRTVVIEIVKEFTSPEFDDFNLGQPLFLRFEKLYEDSPSNIVIVNEHITNNSIVDWFDFHIAVTSNLQGNNNLPTVGFDSGHIFTAGVAGNPFQTVEFSLYNGLDGMPTKIDFYDGTVPSGSYFQPGLNSSYISIITDMEVGDVFWLKEYPTIPEPTTVAFLTLGSVILSRRRKNA
jgi:hypothetical protein